MTYTTNYINFSGIKKKQEAQLLQRGRACFVFVCSQLQHTYSAVFLITSYCGFRFTSA